MGMYIDIAFAAILAGIIIFNLVRGFIKALYPFRKWAALAIAWMTKAPVAQYISGFFNVEGIKKNMYDRAYAMWGEVINSTAATAPEATAPESYSGIFGFLENMIPGIRDLCAQAVRDGVTDVAHTVSVFISENVTNLIFQAAAFIGLFIVLMLGLTIVLKIVDVMCRKNALGVMNRLLGGIVGAVSGLIIVWGISVIVYLIAPAVVESSQVATWMVKSFFLSKFFGIG